MKDLTPEDALAAAEQANGRYEPEVTAVTELPFSEDDMKELSEEAMKTAGSMISSIIIAAIILGVLILGGSVCLKSQVTAERSDLIRD